MPSGLSTDEVGEKTLDYSLPPKRVEKFLSKEAYVSKGEDYWKEVSSSLIKKLSDKSQKRIRHSEGFDEIRKDIVKMKKRGRTIKISEILEEKENEKNDKEKGSPLVDNTRPNNKDLQVKAKPTPENDNGVLSPEEKKKKYLERADIQEAINIMVDYIGEDSKEPMTVGAKAQ